MKKLLFLLFFILCFNYKNSEALDCIEGSYAQSHMTICANERLEEEKKKLDIVYKAYIKFLDKEDYSMNWKKQFVETHVAWIKYKDLYCQCEGGTICGLEWASCQATKTKERLKEIEEDFGYEKSL